MMRRFIAAVAAIALWHQAALAVPPSPPSPPQNVGQTLYHSVWKTGTSTASVDSSGNTFYPSGSTKTAYLAVPVDNNATAVRIWLQNQTTNSWTISGISVSPSSELALAASTTNTVGITAYDSTATAQNSLCGSTNTEQCWTLVTWGNNGVPTTALPGQVPLGTPANAVTCTSASSTSTTLVCNSYVSGIAVGQKVVIPATSGTYPALASEDTWVTAVPSSGCGSTCDVTIGPAGLAHTLPAGVTVYFLPTSFTVPAATAPPVPAIIASDIVPISQLPPRLDGAPLNGQNLVAPAGVNGLTVSGAPLNGLFSLSSGTSAPVPAGSTLTACEAMTITSQVTPGYTIPFSSTSSLQTGMYVTLGGMTNSINGGAGNMFQNGQQIDFAEGIYHGIVQSISSNTSVTLNNPLPFDWNDATTGALASGEDFQFTLPLVLTAAANSETTTIYVTLANGGGIPAAIPNGLYVIGTGFASGTTVSGYNSTTGAITLSAGMNSGASLNIGDPVGVGVNLASSGTASNGTSLPFSTDPANFHWILEGAYVSGTGFPSHDPVVSITGAPAINVLWSPTQTIAANTVVNLCRDFVVQNYAAKGATQIQIVPPRRLLLVRIDVTSNGANFWSRNQDQIVYRAQQLGIPRWFAGQCGTGNDGVFTPSSISNTTGSCNNDDYSIPWAVETFSPQKSLNYAMVGGDSHFDNGTSKNAGFIERLAAQQWSPTLPISGIECAWGGEVSPVFDETAYQCLNFFQPDIAFVAGWTWNDATDLNSQLKFQTLAQRLINYAKSYSGVAIISQEYTRAKYGCNTATGAGATAMLNLRAYWNSYTQPNGPSVMQTWAIADPNATGYTGVNYTDDCIHANDYMEGYMEQAAASLLGQFKFRWP